MTARPVLREDAKTLKGVMPAILERVFPVITEEERPVERALVPERVMERSPAILQVTDPAGISVRAPEEEKEEADADGQHFDKRHN